MISEQTPNARSSSIPLHHDYIRITPQKRRYSSYLPCLRSRQSSKVTSVSFVTHGRRKGFPYLPSISDISCRETECALRSLFQIKLNTDVPSTGHMVAEGGGAIQPVAIEDHRSSCLFPFEELALPSRTPQRLHDFCQVMLVNDRLRIASAASLIPLHCCSTERSCGRKRSGDLRTLSQVT